MPEFLKKLEAEGIDTETGMRFMGNDTEQYAEVLRMFVNESGEKKEKLAQFLNEEKWKDYGILIHAVKSNLKSIGGDQLAEKAFALEKAAKAGDGVYVKANHVLFLREWEKLLIGLKYIPELGIIKAILEQEKETALECTDITAVETEDALSENDFKEKSSVIAGYLDNFEVETAKEELSALKENTLNIRQKHLLIDVEKAIREYDYDKAISLLTE